MIRKVFIICSALLIFNAAAAEKISIIATADLHGRLREFAKLAVVIRRYPDAVKIDAGDLTQGDAVCDLFPHGAMAEALNSLKYDIFVPGNHDFEWGAENTRLFAKKFSGKILLGQCVKADFPFARWTVLERGGRRCAFIGFTEDKQIADGSLLPEYSFRTDTLTVLREILDEIRQVKPYPDAVVLIWHSSFYSKSGSLRTIVRDFPEIDAVICAHSHSESPGMRAASSLAVQPGAYGTSAAFIEIEFDGRNNKTVTSGLLRRGGKSDSAVMEIWERYSKAAGEKFSEKVCEVSSAAEFKKFCASRIKAKCSADAVLLDIREPQKYGVITVLDIMKIMPYSNRICLLETDAAALRAMAEKRSGGGRKRFILFPDNKEEGKIILAVNDYILRSSPDLQKYKISAVPTPFYERTVILNREL